MELLAKEYEGKSLVKSSVYKESPRLVKITPDQCKKLCDAVSFEYREGYENRVIERITTTETVDREGDIVRAKGIDNSQFRIEPVVLYAHNRDDIPVARSLKEWIDNKIVGWRSWDMFFDNDIDTTGRSDLIFRFVNSGAMRGGSIGFLPISVKYDHSDEERVKLGLGKYGCEFVECLKLEHSACSIPANQEALVSGLKSLNQKQLKKSIRKEDLDIMENQKLLEDNLIDVFSNVLEVERVISVPPTTEKKTDEVKHIINLNVDISEVNKKINEVTEKINSFNENIEKVQKSLNDQFSDLITTANKVVSVIEQKDTENDLYDQKDLESILKL